MTNEITTLQFNSDQFGQLRAIQDESGEPWFVAVDVCNALGLANPSVSVNSLDFDERSKLNLGRQGEANIVSETHSDGHITVQRTAKVTGKGQQYFINRFIKAAQ